MCSYHPPVETVKLVAEPTIVKLWKSMQKKIQAGDHMKDQNAVQDKVGDSLKIPKARPSTKSVPLKDISNAGGKSTIGSMAAKKTTKQYSTLAKDKASTSGATSFFPISCDMDLSGSVFHTFSSLDAKFGHSPPEELVGNESSMIEASLDADCVNNKVDVSTPDDNNLVVDLCSSKEGDMVIS